MGDYHHSSVSIQTDTLHLPSVLFLAASSKQGDMFKHKWGPGGVDRPSRSSYCPVHIAVTYNHAVSLLPLSKVASTLYS